MDIQELTLDDMKDVSEWLARLNEQDEHFIAWLESSVEGIQEQLSSLLAFEESLAWLSKENGQVTGFIGVIPFFEQGICRLIGPFTQDSEPHLLNQLWETAKPVVERHFSAVKVAFFKRNTKLTQFCEEHDFHCYNIEKTLLLEQNKLPQQVVADGIVSYEPSHYEGVNEIHPKAGFYTMDEMTYLLQDPNNHLWCYIENEEVIGYIYFEEITGMDEGEICFVNVREDARGQGIGTQLIHYASYQAFHKFNLSLVTISVRTTNEDAEKLYKQLGFQDGPTIYAYEKLT